MFYLRPALNIHANSSDWRAALLSNPASTPFFYGDYLFPSVESALQGIKFKDAREREKVFRMKGKSSLKYAHKHLSNKHLKAVYWNDNVIEYNSNKHRLLLTQLIGAKISQNKEIQEVLLGIVEYFIYHDVGSEDPATSLPEKILILTLLQQRQLLQKIQELK